MGVDQDVPGRDVPVDRPIFVHHGQRARQMNPDADGVGPVGLLSSGDALDDAVGRLAVDELAGDPAVGTALARSDRGGEVGVLDLLDRLQLAGEPLQLGLRPREVRGEHLHRHRLRGLGVVRQEDRPAEAAADHPPQLVVAEYVADHGAHRVVGVEFLVEFGGRLDRAQFAGAVARRVAAGDLRRVRLVGEVPGLQAEVRVADAEDRAGADDLRLGDPLPVDVGAPSPLEVGDRRGVAVDLQAAVLLGDVPSLRTGSISLRCIGSFENVLSLPIIRFS